MSQIDSSQRPLDGRSTINKLINQSINIIDDEDEAEKWKKWNEQQVKKQLKIDKLENLAQANRKNEVFIENQDPKTTG